MSDHDKDVEQLLRDNAELRARVLKLEDMLGESDGVLDCAGAEKGQADSQMDDNQIFRHDLNNLFTVIKGNAELLRTCLPEGAPALELGEEILAACSKAMGLTSKI